MTLRRRTLGGAAMTLVFSLGVALAVVVSGPATAAPSSSTSAPQQTTTGDLPTTPAGPQTPASRFFVINGTVDAASDHEIVGSSAFPNYATGAVDNYYAKAHSHVDNSPFAQGTASPADTGPVGQTAAAGNFQQPQYADARWPGGPDKASYGNQGGPYATASAGEYEAKADASEPSNSLSAPGTTGKLTLPVPKGFDAALRQALALWSSKWQPRLVPGKPVPRVTTPTAPVPIPKPGVTVPKADLAPRQPAVTTPAVTVTSPIAPLAAPNDAGSPSPAPPSVTVSVPTVPSGGSSGPPRLLSASSAAPPADGETLLSSSTLAALVPSTDADKADPTPAKTTTASTTTTAPRTGTTAGSSDSPYTLVTSGESRLGRVSIGGGQIVIEGIHVTASIRNDGTPSYKAAISVASATIGGVPVTIDEDGVHVAGQGGALPYQQASDALNSALKQAGVQIFLVAPQVTSCGQSPGGSGGPAPPSTTTTTSTTTTPASNPSKPASSCDQPGSSPSECGQSGPGVGGLPTGTTTSSTTTTTSTNQTTTTTPCGQTDTTGCEPGGTTTGATTTTGPATTTTRTTTTSGLQPTTTSSSTTTTTPGSCGAAGTMPTSTTGACPPGGGTGAGTTTTAASPGALPGGTSAPSPLDPMNPTGGAGSTEQTVTATGVHVVFTQPVNQSGVPSQYVEHILGEVFVDSLAVPAPPLTSIDLSSSLAAGSPAGLAGSTASCGVAGAQSSKKASGSSAAGGGSSSAGGSATSSLAGGTAASGALAPGGTAVGATSGGGPGSAVASLPASFAAALRKPAWLLVAYLVWQALVIGTGVSLWNWRREDVT